jgi:hypothetical protein
MRFMVIRKADNETEAGVLPSEELITAMMAYNEELVTSGKMLAGEGLHPSSRGAKVSFSGGKPTVLDGPFAETKELIAGFSIIEAESRDEVIELVKRWPAIDGGGNVQIEIRQILEAADFGEAFTPELQAQEQRLRETAQQG